MFKLDARISDMLSPDDLLLRCGLERGGPVQQVIDDAVIRECAPYVPASPDRTLEFSARIATQIGSGEVIWNMPYARYMYYGVLVTDERGRTWVGRGEKKPVVHPDRPLQYDKAQNPLAGAYWFDRMKADRMEAILEEARKAVGGGTNGNTNMTR